MNCNDCDRPLATSADADACPCDGPVCTKCAALCWGDFNHGCTNPIDWRARALLAESARDALTADLHKAEARLKKVRPTQCAEQYVCTNCGATMKRWQEFEEYQHRDCGGLVRLRAEIQRDAAIKERDEARAAVLRPLTESEVVQALHDGHAERRAAEGDNAWTTLVKRRDEAVAERDLLVANVAALTEDLAKYRAECQRMRTEIPKAFRAGFEFAQESAEVSEHDGWHRRDPYIDWTIAEKGLEAALVAYDVAIATEPKELAK